MQIQDAKYQPKTAKKKLICHKNSILTVEKERCPYL